MIYSGLTLQERYAQLESDRLVFLNRARRASELTLPTLVPPQAHSKSTIYYTPWQGIGARGVNNLASKLLLSLFPPNSPFFRLTADDFTMDRLAGSPDKRAVVEEGLAKIERSVQTEIESTGMRSPIFLALKHLIVAGNVLLYLPKDGGVRVYRLDSYVVKRDVMGDVLEVIAKDEVSPEMLSEEDRALLDPPLNESEKSDKSESYFSEVRENEKNVKIFTHWCREDNKWITYQEINKKQVPGSYGTYPIDKPPMMALRWNAVENEDYGRGYVEEYLGDLISLEGLSKAVVEASAVAAKVVFMVNPNGVTRIKDLTTAESGDVIIGKHDDVHSLQSEKQADMRIAFEAGKSIQDRLSMAFLLNSSVQRQAERVTAEEIRFMAGELEDALGGVYSVLSQELQLPMVIRLMDRMTRQKRLTPLPKGVVKPEIVTGLEALGRGHDLNRYLTLMQVLQPLGPQVIAQYIRPNQYIRLVATSLGIDPNDLVKTDQEIAQEQQQAAAMNATNQMMQLAGKAAPNIVRGMSDRAARVDDAQMQKEQPAA